MIMGTKTCKVCGRELPLSAFANNRYGTPVSTCRECVNEKRAQTRFNRAQMGGKTPPFPDELLDGKQPREVIDLMVRCRKWLESRGYEIAMSCVYKEVKIRKIKLE